MKHVLEIPYGAEELKTRHGVKNIKGGYGLYSGVLLPRDLRPFQSQDFSYARWLEDENNAHVVPPTINGKHQITKKEKETSTQLSNNYKNHHPQSLIIGDRFSGKNNSILHSLTGIYSNKKLHSLIVTRKSFIPYWRTLLQSHPDVCKKSRILIIDYSDMKKLISTPSNARLVKKQQRKNKLIATQGLTKINWDVIIFDEAEQLSEPSSIRTATAATLANLNKNIHPYTIISLNQPLDNPLKYTIASKTFDRVTPEYWVSYLQEQGYHIETVKNKFYWHGELPANSPLRKKYDNSELIYNKVVDQKLMTTMLSKNTVIRHQDPQSHIFLPIDVPPKYHEAYKQAWSDTKKILNHNNLNHLDETIKIFNNRINYTKKNTLALLVKDLTNATKIIFRTNIEQDWFKTEFYKNGFNAIISSGDPLFDAALLNEADIIIANHETDYSQVNLPVKTISINTDLYLTDFKNNPPEVKTITPYYSRTVDEKVITSIDKITVHYRRAAASGYTPNRLS